MLLCEIAYTDNYNSGNDLRQEYLHVKHFHKQFQQKIIDDNICKKRQEVTEELYSSPQI